jgi:hypothetical protein
VAKSLGIRWGPLARLADNQLIESRESLFDRSRPSGVRYTSLAYHLIGEDRHRVAADDGPLTGIQWRSSNASYPIVITITTVSAKGFATGEAFGCPGANGCDCGANGVVSAMKDPIDQLRLALNVDSGAHLLGALANPQMRCQRTTHRLKPGCQRKPAPQTTGAGATTTGAAGTTTAAAGATTTSLLGRHPPHGPR